MQNRNLLISIAVGIVVVLGLGFYLLSQNKAVAPTASVTPTPTPEASIMESASPSASGSPEAMIEKKEETVIFNEKGFSPTTLTIKKGTTVVWENKSGAMGNVSSDPHPIHTAYPPLNLGNFADGDKVSLTFDKAGTFAYHNHLNAQFKGTVIVQ